MASAQSALPRMAMSRVSAAPVGCDQRRPPGHAVSRASGRGRGFVRHGAQQPPQRRVADQFAVGNDGQRG